MVMWVVGLGIFCIMWLVWLVGVVFCGLMWVFNVSVVLWLVELLVEFFDYFKFWYEFKMGGGE